MANPNTDRVNRENKASKRDGQMPPRSTKKASEQHTTRKSKSA